MTPPSQTTNRRSQENEYKDQQGAGDCRVHEHCAFGVCSANCGSHRGSSNEGARASRYRGTCGYCRSGADRGASTDPRAGRDCGPGTHNCTRGKELSDSGG